MKTKATLLSLGLIISLSGWAQVFQANKGMISFFSWASIGTIDATSMQLSSAIDTANNEVVFSVPIRTFTFQGSKMQTDFNEDYMESEKYPDATYKGIIQTKVDWKKEGQVKVVASGTLTLHHISKQRTDSATVTIKNGEISVKGNFIVATEDYGIRIPEILSKNISKEIYIMYGCLYQPVCIAKK
jgi:polyisoprenoid-binding protein YceI